MEWIYERAGTAIPQLMREMAIYLVQFKPVSADCLYSKLLKVIEDAGLSARVLHSTLNYDCVLEFCVASRGGSIAWFGSDAGSAVPVWKLHGSCNFFSAQLQAQGIQYTPGVTFQGGIRALPNVESVVQHCLTETALAPVMCLYMRNKPLAVSPAEIRELQERWATLVETARAVFCIGVRPLAEDSHVWEPIQRTKATVAFVGGKTEWDTWCATRMAGPSVYLGNRFGSSFSKLAERIEDYGNER